MNSLTAIALLPPLILMILVYRKDQVEKEPIGLIVKTIIFGALCAIPTVIVEVLLGGIIESVFNTRSVIGLLIDNMIGVALVEEFFKMQACKLSVWKNKEFNYTFDGLVYSVAAAIGFAALENLLYVYDYGFGTGILRAITAIPGHTIFGIFMGMNLGIAKLYEINGDKKTAKHYKRLALIVPMIIHGLYDFMCSVGSSTATIIFFIALIILDIVAIRKVNQFERMDTSIYQEPDTMPEDPEE